MYTTDLLGLLGSKYTADKGCFTPDTDGFFPIFFINIEHCLYCKGNAQIEIILFTFKHLGID